MTTASLGNLSTGTRRAWMAFVLSALVMLAAGAANARAGTYVINDCPAASGGDYTVGPWTAFGSLSSPGVFKQTCNTPGESFGFSGGMSNNTTTGEQLQAPSSITIQHLTLWWEAPGPTGGWSWAQIDLDSPGWSRPFEKPTPMRANGAGTPPTELSMPAGTIRVGVQIYCTTSQDCTYGEDPLKIYGSQVTLFDSSTPTGSVTGGSLAGSTVGFGTQSFTYTAEDGGSGVRLVELLVDGHAAAENSYVSECPYESFAACPPNVSGIISWNTDGVSAGAHEVGLRITSAAGNTAIVDDHEVTVGDASSPSTSGSSTGSSTGSPTGGSTDSPTVNSGSNPLGPVANATATASTGGAQTEPGGLSASPGPANGTNASDQAVLTAHWTHASGPALTGRYGTTEQVTGRLTTTSGQPIVGASIDASETPTYAGAHAQTLPNPYTGPSGEWSLALPHGMPSSSLRFGYRSHLNDTTPTATATLTLRVHAGIALGIAPRITRVGRRIHFTGIVHGPIPPGGKQLVLEASSGGEWIQFDTVHTNAQGRYHASYRFKFPGPVTYRFRVVSPYEADFPCLARISDDVAVREW